MKRNQVTGYALSTAEGNAGQRVSRHDYCTNGHVLEQEQRSLMGLGWVSRAGVSWGRQSGQGHAQFQRVTATTQSYKHERIYQAGNAVAQHIWWWVSTYCTSDIGPPELLMLIQA